MWQDDDVVCWLGSFLLLIQLFFACAWEGARSSFSSSSFCPPEKCEGLTRPPLLMVGKGKEEEGREGTLEGTLIPEQLVSAGRQRQREKRRRTVRMATD